MRMKSRTSTDVTERPFNCKNGRFQSKAKPKARRIRIE
jgi:hypothetical protein